MLNLSGNVAIVWGGGQGMGERSAMRMAEAGADVAIVDLDEGRAGTVAEQVRKIGRRSVAMVADVTDEASVDAAVAKAEEMLGVVTKMVTVVGMSGWRPLIETTRDQWNFDLSLNLTSVFLTTRAVARRLIATESEGSIVVIASVSGMSSAPMHAAYGAAKAGVINLVHSMAVEWSPLIRVNAIAPGAIETVRVKRSEKGDAAHRKRVPMRRMGTTDEIGKAATFLNSDLASFVTGQTLAVDGGWMSAFLMDLESEMVLPTQARGLAG
jgi:NAD(P)-dependent dehydrogenase (short-subunit alcohol dehydrogenase family)